MKAPLTVLLVGESVNTTAVEKLLSDGITPVAKDTLSHALFFYRQ